MEIEIKKVADVIEEFETREVKAKQEVEKLPPWAIAFQKVYALFGDDEDLLIVQDTRDTQHVCQISSSNHHKLEALSKMLKPEIDGLVIELIDEGLDNPYAQIIEDAFSGNPHLDCVRIATESGTEFKHVITTFKDETIQYPADNRFVPHGYETTLAEKLVKDLFVEEFRRSVYITKEKGETYNNYVDAHDDMDWEDLVD